MTKKLLILINEFIDTQKITEIHLQLRKEVAGSTHVTKNNKKPGTYRKSFLVFIFVFSGTKNPLESNGKKIKKETTNDNRKKEKKVTVVIDENDFGVSEIEINDEKTIIWLDDEETEKKKRKLFQSQMMKKWSKLMLVRPQRQQLIEIIFLDY